MPRDSDNYIKVFISQVGGMMDARFKTFEINFKAFVKDEIKASEGRIRKDMATKDDLRETEARIRGDMATKDDISRLEGKIDNLTDIVGNHEVRIQALEDISNPTN